MEAGEYVLGQSNEGEHVGREWDGEGVWAHQLRDGTRSQWRRRHGAPACADTAQRGGDRPLGRVPS